MERLRRVQGPEEIVKELHTTEGYVNNIKSELKIRYGIVFTGPQNGLHETHDPNAINAEAHTNLQTVPVDQAGLAPLESHLAGVETAPRALGRPESTTVDSELQTIRREVSDLESSISEKQKIQELSRKKHALLMREQALSKEAELRRVVSDICPDMREMWTDVNKYGSVMCKIFLVEPYRWTYVNNLAGSRVWDPGTAWRRFPLILKQVFYGTSPELRIRKAASETILTDSIAEFIEIFESYLRCPGCFAPLFPTGSLFRCCEGHVWPLMNPMSR